MHHTTTIPSNSSLKFYVIRLGYFISMNATLPYLLKDNSNLKNFLGRKGLSWSMEFHPSFSMSKKRCWTWNYGSFVFVCSCFQFYHTLGHEKNGLCGCKSHCWHTFPQADNNIGPQCGPKQHVIIWVCIAKPKLYEHEMMRFNL